ncbi:hypothetical protein TNCV_3779121 [Trichonephila clavipes]|nr:hypothetical protein TNCV_3779121 [Trichonephila clavipes]
MNIQLLSSRLARKPLEDEIEGFLQISLKVFREHRNSALIKTLKDLEEDLEGSILEKITKLSPSSEKTLLGHVFYKFLMPSN